MNFPDQPKLRTKICFFQAREAMFFFGFGFLVVAVVMAFGPSSWEYAYSTGILPPIHLCCSSCWTFILMCANSKCAYGYYSVCTILTASLSMVYMTFFLINKHHYAGFRDSKSALVFVIIAFLIALFLQLLCAVVYCRLSFFDRGVAGDDETESEKVEDLYEVKVKSEKIDND